MAREAQRNGRRHVLGFLPDQWCLVVCVYRVTSEWSRVLGGAVKVADAGVWNEMRIPLVKLRKIIIYPF